MAGRTLFNLRVVRCPACNASLAIESGDKVVVCEYCDVRVDIDRRAPARVARAPATGQNVAAPQYSAFAWIVLTWVLLAVIGALVLLFVQRDATQADESVFVSSFAPPLTAPPEPESQSSVLVSPEPGNETAGVEPAPAPVATPTKKKKKKRASTPEPAGPMFSVADARAALEPKVRACMRDAKIHSLLAYMGNKKVGAVTVLKDSRTRVDGTRKDIRRTPLGKCMDAAGRTLRVRAFKSNYVRFQLENKGVPDPHGHLPQKSDHKDVGSTIAEVDDKIIACGLKHGEEGAKEVFYFVIDGPTGKVSSVRGSYRSKSFRKCSEKVYRGLQFTRVQEWTVKHTKHIQM